MIFYLIFESLSIDQYYTAPPDSVFDDIKAGAIQVWKDYDDTYHYTTDKISRIKEIQNIRDNAWYIVAMFDQDNQMKLWSLLTDQTKEYLLCLLHHDK